MAKTNQDKSTNTNPPGVRVSQARLAPIKGRVRPSVTSGKKAVEISVIPKIKQPSPSPFARIAGMFKDDEDWAEVERIIEENRTRECEGVGQN